MKEMLQALLAVTQNDEEIRPVVQQVVATLKSYGPEVASLLDAATDYLVDRKAAAVKRLQEQHDFTREEAITMTLDVYSNIERRLREQGKSK